MKKIITFLTIFVLLALTCTTNNAYADDACSDLMLQPYGGATITSATMVPASGDTPAYCWVTATAGKETDIEVRLPDNWKKRYLHIGGAGFDGWIPLFFNNELFPLQQGFVMAASNGGHRVTRTDILVDASFGLDPELTQDYAYVAIGTTVRVAKALTAAYYGERPHYSYWLGYSNGGRGGYNAAAKFGSEFDGIIAVCSPSDNIAGVVAGWSQNIPALALVSKVDLINAAMVAACDKLDGLEDGVISNPDECSFDPTAVPGLTETDINLVNTLHKDVKLTDGTIVYSRFGYGPLSAAWIIRYYYLSAGHMQYIVYRDPDYDIVTSWDIDTDYPAAKTVLEDVYDFAPDDETLAHYLKSGKKIMVWHGADDTLISHYETIRWMIELESAAGRVGRKNLKWYIVPGYGHCEGGTGVNRIDPLPAMVDWVENGKAPKKLTVSKVEYATGTILFTRPQCEYPRYPHYTSGDPNDAGSFVCKRPKN